MAVQILTVIGAIILCIALMLVSMICIVLLSPIHYEITGGKESENSFCKLKGHFLFKKIKFIFSYNSGVKPMWRVKVFKKIYRSSKKKQRSQQKTAPKPMPEQSILITRERKPEIIVDTNALEVDAEQHVFPSSIDLAQLKKEHNLDGQEVRRVKLKDIPKTTKPPLQTKTIFDMQFKIPRFISNLWLKIQTFLETAKIRKQQIKSLLDKRDIWHALKKLLKNLVKAMKADQFSIVAKIGFADPAITGQFMGLVSILIAKFGDAILITPDFSKENFEDIQLYCKGRIFIWRLVHIFIQFICHPSIRTQIKAYRKGSRQDG